MYPQSARDNTFLSYVTFLTKHANLDPRGYDVLKARAWVKWCDGHPLTSAESDLIRPRPIPAYYPAPTR